MLCIVMENITYPDLASRIYEAKIQKSFISESIIVTLFRNLLYVLQDMHKEGISHMDINLNSVFLGNNNKVKIGDFTH